MEIRDAIEHRLEVREFADEPVPDEDVRAVLDAARLAPSGINRQHWHFVHVADDGDLAALAERSETGGWVAGADFAVVVCTDPEYDWHVLDAGRAVEHVCFAAADRGLGACIYTGLDEAATRKYLGVPDDMAVPVVVGVGVPAGDHLGTKDRKPLAEVASSGRYGESLDLASDG
mgnify:CR=1 FL=1